MTWIESGSFISPAIPGAVGVESRTALRHGGEDQALALVTDVGPAGDLVNGAMAAGTEAAFHPADVDAGRGHGLRHRRRGHRAAREDGAGHARGGFALELLRDPDTGVDQRVEVDAGVDAEPAQQPDHILGRDIARGARGIGATAEAGDGTVEDADAHLQRGVDVGRGHAVGVVEMPGDLLQRDAPRHGLDHVLGALRRAGAYGVAEADFVAAHLDQRMRDVGHGQRA
jgi:hypothetical protein